MKFALQDIAALWSQAWALAEESAVDKNTVSVAHHAALTFNITTE